MWKTERARQAKPFFRYCAVFSLFLLGLLGVLLILLTLLVIAAEAARIICLGPAAKKQQQPMQNSPADFRRSSQANIRVSCHLIEKHIYGEILLSPYEERTLNHFLEKLTEPVPGCS